ncbi:CDP-glycerol glycerophosphotransferase family protein [Candidatus Neomarinimicrobiota bacterium]
MLRYLLFVTKPYSISVLQPVADFINGRDDAVMWYMGGSVRDMSAPGPALRSNLDVLDYQPQAILVPGNVVPYYWPGLKVQLFHGLGEEKSGHYRVTGFFDLYCTPGPYITRRFEQLARKHGHFFVRETGWPKLDRMSNIASIGSAKTKFGLDATDKVILYAPTFSPRFSSAADLLPAVKTLATGPYRWIIKFHDLMDKELAEDYRQALGSRAIFPSTPDIIPLLEAADIMLTDTSSVAYEFLPLDRPIITYRATARVDKGINITRADELGNGIQRSIDQPCEYSNKRHQYLAELHPYNDGKSASRVIAAIDEVANLDSMEGLKSKPLNLFRKWQIRRMDLI